MNQIMNSLKTDLVSKICWEILKNNFTILLVNDILWKFILYKDLEPTCFHYNVKIALNKLYILSTNVITYNYLVRALATILWSSLVLDQKWNCLKSMDIWSVFFFFFFNENSLKYIIFDWRSHYIKATWVIQANPTSRTGSRPEHNGQSLASWKASAPALFPHQSAYLWNLPQKENWNE